MIENLIKNYKTTSLGLTLMVGTVVHLIFAIKAGTADENLWTASGTAIVAALGLLFAGDASKSAADSKRIESKVDANSTAIVTGDTTAVALPVVPAQKQV